MTQEAMQNFEPSTMTQVELLQAILESQLSSDAVYPWNFKAAEQYFTQLESRAETDLPALDLGEAESEQFFGQLARLWAEGDAVSTDVASLADGLAARCITFPQAVLAAIAARATTVIDNQLSALEQLVQCVQAALPQWDVEDLEVMARPYAFAMRSQEPKLPENVDWQSLSEVEQGRLAMAIAHWILNELENRKS